MSNNAAETRRRGDRAAGRWGERAAGRRGDKGTGRWGEKATGRQCDVGEFEFCLEAIRLVALIFIFSSWSPPSPRLRIAHRSLQTGLRFPTKALIPSLASFVFINSCR